MKRLARAILSLGDSPSPVRRLGEGILLAAICFVAACVIIYLLAIMGLLPEPPAY